MYWDDRGYERYTLAHCRLGYDGFANGPIVVNSGTPLSLAGCQSLTSEKACLRQGPSALLLTNWMLKTVESLCSHLIPMAIWVRLGRPWP